MITSPFIIPPTIRNPAKWLERTAERKRDRRPLMVYPVLKPGEGATGTRHGREVTVKREARTPGRNKYNP